MNFFKLSPHRTQSGGGEGKIEASPLCPPGRRKRGRIDTNEGGRALNRRQLRRAHCSRKEVATAGSLAYTGTSVQCITLENVSSRNAINVALFQFLINRRRRQCKLHCVALSVNSCVLRRCALFYVRYYRLGARAAGERDGRRRRRRRKGFGKRGDLLNTNECSSMNSKVPHHYTTDAQRGRRRFNTRGRQGKRYSAYKGRGSRSCSRNKRSRIHREPVGLGSLEVTHFGYPDQLPPGLVLVQLLLY